MNLVTLKAADEPECGFNDTLTHYERHNDFAKRTPGENHIRMLEPMTFRASPYAERIWSIRILNAGLCSGLFWKSDGEHRTP
jgi:hypothetical protein